MAAVERTGVLVIRVWLEQGLEQDALRARITQTLDISVPNAVEKAASSEPEIVDAVEQWLRAFVSRSATER
jgi:hypothetical protein